MPKTSRRKSSSIKKQHGGTCFDEYCDMCGLPFIELELEDGSSKPLPGTKWLKDAILEFEGKRIHLVHNGCEEFELRGGDRFPEEVAEYCVGLEGGLYSPTLRSEFPEARLYHENCIDRPDKDRVLALLPKIKREYQDQYFDVEAFLEDGDAVTWLAKNPKPSKKPAPPPQKPAGPARPMSWPLPPAKAPAKKPAAPPSPPPAVDKKQQAPAALSDLTVAQLLDVSAALRVKKARVKADIIKNIRDFVCK